MIDWVLLVPLLVLATFGNLAGPGDEAARQALAYVILNPWVAVVMFAVGALLVLVTIPRRKS